MRDKIYLVYPDGKTKALTMSYDDGVIEDRRLVEIFNRYGIKGSFHLNAGLLDNSARTVTSSEVATLYRGHEVSCHGFKHLSLDRISRVGVVREMLDDRDALEKLVGYPVRGMSYAWGVWNHEIIEILKALDFAYARTTEPNVKPFQLPDNFLEWRPTCHHNDNIIERAEQFKKSPYLPTALFYVWGHSYEFERQKNWGLIEEFCDAMSKDQNVWHATNIEIYDYIAATRRLAFSADLSVVKNPNAMSVWLRVNDESIEIRPGELKDLRENS